MLPYPGIRFGLNVRTAALGDGPGHSRAVFQGFIGGVDDRLSRFGGDITLYQLEGRARGKGGFDQQGVHRNILPPLNDKGAHPGVPLWEIVFYVTLGWLA
jgi:hypothetical protein